MNLEKPIPDLDEIQKDDAIDELNIDPAEVDNDKIF